MKERETGRAGMSEIQFFRAISESNLKRHHWHRKSSVQCRGLGNEAEERAECAVNVNIIITFIRVNIIHVISTVTFILSYCLWPARREVDRRLSTLYSEQLSPNEFQTGHDIFMIYMIYMMCLGRRWPSGEFLEDSSSCFYSWIITLIDDQALYNIYENPYIKCIYHTFQHSRNTLKSF